MCFFPFLLARSIINQTGRFIPMAIAFPQIKSEAILASFVRHFWAHDVMEVVGILVDDVINKARRPTVVTGSYLTESILPPIIDRSLSDHSP